MTMGGDVARRLAAVEAAVAELRRDRPLPQPPGAPLPPSPPASPPASPPSPGAAGPASPLAVETARRLEEVAARVDELL
eukprot:gene47825-10751_t